MKQGPERPRNYSKDGNIKKYNLLEEMQGRSPTHFQQLSQIYLFHLLDLSNDPEKIARTQLKRLTNLIIKKQKFSIDQQILQMTRK